MITFVRGTTYLAALILNVFLLILVSECHKAPEPKQISYSEFLFEVGAGHVADGFDTSRGVIIIAATNTPEVLDTPLMRAGRFDRQIIVDRPDLEGRETILKIYVGKIKLAWDVDSDNSRSWKTRSP